MLFLLLVILFVRMLLPIFPIDNTIFLLLFKIPIILSIIRILLLILLLSIIMSIIFKHTVIIILFISLLHFIPPLILQLLINPNVVFQLPKPRSFLIGQLLSNSIEHTNNLPSRISTALQREGAPVTSSQLLSSSMVFQCPEATL